MTDILYKGHFKNIDIAFVYAETADTTNRAVIAHNCDPVAAHILSRTITALLLAAAQLPEKQRLNGHWKYDGALRTIAVDAGSDATVRGFISPTRLYDAGDNLESIYGNTGSLTLFTTEDAKVINTGTTKVSLLDPVNDLAFHYCTSNQIETEMQVMVGFNPNPEQPINICRGWMLQALPNADLQNMEIVRKKMNSEKFREMMQQKAQSDTLFETLTKVLLEDITDAPEIQMEAGPTPQFKCNCNYDKICTVVKSISIPERMEIARKKEGLEIKCQFCGKPYKLSLDECSRIWNRK